MSPEGKTTNQRPNYQTHHHFPSSSSIIKGNEEEEDRHISIDFDRNLNCSNLCLCHNRPSHHLNNIVIRQRHYHKLNSLNNTVALHYMVSIWDCTLRFAKEHRNFFGKQQKNGLLGWMSTTIECSGKNVLVTFRTSPQASSGN